MSRWTHINGSIRFDNINGIIPAPNFNEIFQTASYEDSDKKWENCNVPKGSEGSIQVNVWKNKDSSSVAAYCVNVFGDLRDFGDKEQVDNVVMWFNRICLDKKYMIRQAILQVEDEGLENSCILRYSVVEDKNEIVKIDIK